MEIFGPLGGTAEYCLCVLGYVSCHMVFLETRKRSAAGYDIINVFLAMITKEGP